MTSFENIEDYDIINKVLRKKIFSVITLQEADINKNCYEKKSKLKKFIKQEIINSKKRKKLKEIMLKNEYFYKIIPFDFNIKEEDSEISKNFNFLIFMRNFLNMKYYKYEFKNFEHLVCIIYFDILQKNIMINLTLEHFKTFLKTLIFYEQKVSVMKNRKIDCCICLENIEYYKNNLCCGTIICIRCFYLQKKNVYNNDKCMLCNTEKIVFSKLKYLCYI